MKKKILAFGEIMLRLTPPDKLCIAGARSFDACYGGSESNVLVALSAFGDRTDYFTALPDNPLGEAAIRHLRSFGVGTDNIIVRGDRLGMYFLEEGFGDRGARVIYNRKGSEISKLCESDPDYDKLFADCSFFHISGISFALSESSRALAFRLLSEAKMRSITVSFDFNYRSTLWSAQEAGEVFRSITPFVDVMLCSQRDLVTFLNTTADSFHESYACDLLIVRERELLESSLQSVTATAYKKGCKPVSAAPATFTALERIGSGDAFTAGILHLLANGENDLEKVLDFAIASFVLKHTVKGDVFPLGESSVNTYLSNVSKDVSR